MTSLILFTYPITALLIALILGLVVSGVIIVGMCRNVVREI